MNVYEFEVPVRVRKRLCVSGRLDRETARDILMRLLKDGININTLAKFGEDGRAMEVSVDSDFEVTDP